MNYRFRTIDHPDALGQKEKVPAGSGVEMSFALEEGGICAAARWTAEGPPQRSP